MIAEFKNDLKVKQYWEEKKQYYLNCAYLHRPKTNLEKYEEYKNNKRGLLIGSLVVMGEAIKQIAADLVETGLENIAIARNYALTALEVGDLGQYMVPPYSEEWALYGLYDRIRTANWILTGEKDFKNMEKSLEYLKKLKY